MQIKIILKFHPTPITMSVIKKTTTPAPGCNGKGEPPPCLRWWESKLLHPLWKPVWCFFRKLEIEQPCDLAIPLLGMHPKESESAHNRDLCTLMFIMAVFMIAKL
jgi:hypothetical protein